MEAEVEPKAKRHHDRMTRYPLTTQEQERLLAALESYDPKKEHPKNSWPWDPVRCFYLLYRHGMHISVLRHPRQWDLHVDETQRAMRWSRVKTRQHMEHPLTPKEMQWVPSFVRELYSIDERVEADRVANDQPAHVLVRQKWNSKKGVGEREQDGCYLQLARILSIVAEDIGLPGLSSRGLRHTFADWLDEQSGHDLAAVEVGLGVTPAVARMYSNKSRSEKVKELMERRQT